MTQFFLEWFVATCSVMALATCENLARINKQVSSNVSKNAGPDGLTLYCGRSGENKQQYTNTLQSVADNTSTLSATIQDRAMAGIYLSKLCHT